MINIAIVFLLLFKSSVGLLPSLCRGAGLPDGSPSIPKELHCPRMFLHRRYIPRPLPKGGALRYSSIPKASESRILFSQCKDNSPLHILPSLSLPNFFSFLAAQTICLCLTTCAPPKVPTYHLCENCTPCIQINAIHRMFPSRTNFSNSIGELSRSTVSCRNNFWEDLSTLNTYNVCPIHP